jgi:hypothetical protein
MPGMDVLIKTVDLTIFPFESCGSIIYLLPVWTKIPDWMECGEEVIDACPTKDRHTHLMKLLVGPEKCRFLELPELCGLVKNRVEQHRCKLVIRVP